MVASLDTRGWLARGARLAVVAAACACACAGWPGPGSGGGGVDAQLLFAGGEFDQAGDALASNIAQWDGGAWAPLAALPLTGDSVSSLAVYGGKVIAGGRFDRAGNFVTNNIAQYDGNIWQPMGLGAENRNSDFAVDVWALTVFNNNLIAAGYFNTAGGIPAANVAQWDGATWSTLGEGLPNEVRALTVYRGQVVAGGDFVIADEGLVTNDLAAWDGSAWNPLGPGVTSNRSRVWAVLEFNGLLMVGGEFLEVAGFPVNNTAIWDGATWRPMSTGVTSVVGPFDPIVKAFVIFQGQLILGGRFQLAGGVQTGNIAAWDGSSFSTLADGLNEQVYSMTVYNGRLIVGGNFDRASGVAAVQIAAWDGSVWSGVAFADTWDVAVYVRALTVAPLPSSCSLLGTMWQAEYQDANGVAVADALIFNDDLTLQQTLVAAVGQGCTANSITWSGDLDIQDSSTAILSYIRCTASGPGCLACGPSREELTRFKFANDCSSMTLVAVNSNVARVYFAS